METKYMRDSVQIRREKLRPKNLVICDREEEYAKNLWKEISERRGLSFQPYLFSDLSRLTDFSETKKIHVLIAGEEFPEDERMRIPAEERFVLVKEKGRDLNEEEKEIFKYQSSDRIISLILKSPGAGEKKIEGAAEFKGDLIGVYSPVHRIGKTRFALRLGEKLSEKGPALYLNMEEYSGMEHYFPNHGENNLGDLLYYAKQENVNLERKLGEMVSSIGRVDYVAPMPVMRDFFDVEAEEWLYMIREIFDRCAYKSIILDLGDCVRGLYEILRQCRTVYTLHTKDLISQAKIRQYTETLRLLGFADVIEHTVLRQAPSKAGEV